MKSVRSNTTTTILRIQTTHKNHETHPDKHKHSSIENRIGLLMQNNFVVIVMVKLNGSIIESKVFSAFECIFSNWKIVIYHISKWEWNSLVLLLFFFCSFVSNMIVPWEKAKNTTEKQRNESINKTHKKHVLASHGTHSPDNNLSCSCDFCIVSYFMYEEWKIASNGLPACCLPNAAHCNFVILFPIYSSSFDKWIFTLQTNVIVNQLSISHFSRLSLTLLL